MCSTTNTNNSLFRLRADFSEGITVKSFKINKRIIMRHAQLSTLSYEDINIGGFDNEKSKMHCDLNILFTIAYSANSEMKSYYGILLAYVPILSVVFLQSLTIDLLKYWGMIWWKAAPFSAMTWFCALFIKYKRNEYIKYKYKKNKQIWP